MNQVIKCDVCGTESAQDYLGGCAKCLLSAAVDLPEFTNPPGRIVRTIQDFELVEQIGLGGMGVVYRARQRSLNREVAIKMLLPGSRALIDRFQIEAEAGAKLHHPNIVPIYEIGGEKDGVYLSMELVKGGNLKQRLDDFQMPAAGQINGNAEARRVQEKIARLLGKVARAVHFAHERGILHRDLKPENILLREDGEPMLTDFGLAKIWDQDQSVTGSSHIFGTLNYIAPEQAAGGRVSRGADIFSLGAILYELLARTPPFRAATPAQTLRQLAEDEPLNLRTINHWIDRDLAMICSKCLQKDFKDRYATAGELAEDLDRWLENKRVHARPLPQQVRVERWIRRNRVVTALLVLLVAGLFTTLFLLMGVVRQKREKDRALETLRTSVGSGIHNAWSPRGFVEITSQQLSALMEDEMAPLPGDHARLKLAVFVHQNPIETVEQYQRLLPYLESEIAREVQRPVRFDLWLYKELAVESLLRDKADFVRVSPIFYAEAKRLGFHLEPLIRQNNPILRGVIFSRPDLGLRSLRELKAYSIIFGESNATVTFEAQRVLALAGLTQLDFSGVTYVEGSPSSEFKKGGYFSRASEALKEVKAGKFDAGVALERQLDESANVTVLARFDCKSPFWAGTPGLDPKMAQAFVLAMERLKDPEVLRSLPEDPRQPHGFERTSAAEYADIEIARGDVARFLEPISNPSQ